MGLIRFLFFEKKHLAYSAFGQDQYFKACNKLSQHGVQYDVARKINANLFSTSGDGQIADVRNATVGTAQYDFYVKKEDQHLAQLALRY